MELIQKLMQQTLPDIYRYEIVENIFSHIYIQNEFFRNSLGISRVTTTKHLKLLVKEGFFINKESW